MNCKRFNIKTQKIWRDEDDAYQTRPSSTGIVLLRDGEIYKTAVLNSENNWTYVFKCLIPWRDSQHEYVYSIDETEVPAGYEKTIDGYNIINTLREIIITGTKTWNDNDDALGLRPTGVQVTLYQNGAEYNTTEYVVPVGQNTVSVVYPPVPLYDDNGNRYIYTIDEEPVNNYAKSIEGFHITNTVASGELIFTKVSLETGAGLDKAVFQLTQSGTLIATAESDSKGKTTFSKLLPGTYNMTETQPPVGFMSDSTVYEVQVSTDGTVSIDGTSAENFIVKNNSVTVINGQKIWSDNNNENDARPDTFIVNLYQDGVLFSQKSIDLAESQNTFPFIFDGLPKSRPNGTAYDYTIGENAVPAGYTSTVMGTTITNNLTSVKVTIFHINQADGGYLSVYQQTVSYGSTITFTARNIVNYTALEPKSITVTKIAKDEEVKFYYEKLP